MNKETSGVDTEEINEKEMKDDKKKDALVTCRILFISVLDKIYIVCLLLSLILATYSNFAGDMSSVSYGFFRRLLGELFIVVGVVIGYFLCNWFYKCYAKTMLCVTDKEIYKEKYLPFQRMETTIPLNKITSITAFKHLWIFRGLIIFQYHRFPMIFFTWNNQEFKDKVEELLVEDSTKVNNQFESKNIINKNQYKYVGILGIVLVGIIVILGIIRLFGFMFSEERQIPANYAYKDYSINLKNDGTCDLNINSYDITACDWHYDSDSKEVVIDYKYKYNGYYSYYYSSDYQSSLRAKYEDKNLIYDNKTFERD